MFTLRQSTSPLRLLRSFADGLRQQGWRFAPIFINNLRRFRG
jgi:hypothetical protein